MSVFDIVVPRPMRPGRDFTVLTGTLVVTAAVGLGLADRAPVQAWFMILGLMSFFVVFLGFSVSGKWRGAFIDDRNRVSLSRLQLLSWSALVLSGLLTAALMNLARGSSTPLVIDVPPSLWVVMGISTSSLIGSPAVRASRERKARARTVRFTEPGLARWSDLFLGEEEGNEQIIDVGKLQMFFFTFILVLVYGAAIAAQLGASGDDTITAFPRVDAGVNMLLAISHAGYLTTKGLPAVAVARSVAGSLVDKGTKERPSGS